MIHYLIILIKGIGIFLLATVAFDVLHFLMHYFSKSQFTFFKRIAALHLTHHRFLNVQLSIHSSLAKRNLQYHVIPEYCTQLFLITLCWFWMNTGGALVAYLIASSIFFSVIFLKGEDVYHRTQIKVSTEKPGFLRFFITPVYHALHHLDPQAYYSSYIKILDSLLGKACGLHNRTITLTGASGALGRALDQALQKQGVKKLIHLKYQKDYNATHFFADPRILLETDILILAHGNKTIEHAQSAHCDSFVFLIELFKKHHTKKFPLEVWAIGSEIECHPAFGNPILKAYASSKRNFAKQAQYYFHDRNIIYRHIVPSAFRSNMGWGLFSASTVVTIALFLIKRGFRYVPVTYTGIAFLNYFKFLRRRHAHPDKA